MGVTDLNLLIILHSKTDSLFSILSVVLAPVQTTKTVQLLLSISKKNAVGCILNNSGTILASEVGFSRLIIENLGLSNYITIG